MPTPFELLKDWLVACGYYRPVQVGEETTPVLDPQGNPVLDPDGNPMTVTTPVMGYLDPDGNPVVPPPVNDIAATLNIADQEVTVPVPLSELQSHIFETGIKLKLMGVAVQADHPARNAAIMGLELEKARFNTVYMHLPVFQQMLQGLVDTGVLTTDEQAAVLALSKKNVSVGSQMGFGRPVEGVDVEKARTL